MWTEQALFEAADNYADNIKEDVYNIIFAAFLAGASYILNNTQKE